MTRGDDLAAATSALNRALHVLTGVDADVLDADRWLALKASLGRELAAFDHAANHLGASFGLNSAQFRILRYLQANVGLVVDKDELSGVAGIHEWARRVRELRTEQGWRIASHETRDDLAPGQYMLEDLEPDVGLAEAWAVAKRIRNLKAGGKTRMLEYLQAVFPRSADKEQLAYVSHPVRESARRLRELAEDGWDVVSNVDDPTLAPGEYRLGSLEQGPPRSREAIKCRQEVFERDGYRCIDCGRSPRSENVQLQAHHKVLVSEGGTNDLGNLVTLCADCHAGRHALHRSQVRDELLFPAR